MDYDSRIAAATLYRDQTQASYEAAQKQASSASTAYNSSFSSAPNYQTLYEQYKQEYENSDLVKNLETDYKQAKDSVDLIKTMIDKLPTSIGQQYGGTGLTQAQRDLAKESQLNNLNKQFTQYNADYEVRYASYEKTVDDAFNRALDVANKDYDSYWDKVKIKYNDWQTAIKNEEQWSDHAFTSQSQLDSINLERDYWELQQSRMQMERYFEQLENQANAQAMEAAKSLAQYNINVSNSQTRSSQAYSDALSGKTSWIDAFSAMRNENSYRSSL